MLRLNSRSRNRNMKNKHSKKVIKSTPEKSKYQEDYNEIILNDLVPEDRKEEFGLGNEFNNKKPNGLNLNFSLGGKKRPNKKTVNKKHQQKEEEILDEVENLKTSKEEVSEEVVETNKTKKNQKNKKRPNHKNKSNKNQQNIDNEASNNSKSQNKVKYGNNKANQKDESENKNTQGKKANQKTNLGKAKKKVKKSENDNSESINTSHEKSKTSNQKIINPKKRKRPNMHKEEVEDDARLLEEVEPEVQIETKENNNEDIITFRGNENNEEYNIEEPIQKVSEIKEVKSKFENIVWSEDNFPKK